jgi:ribosome-binding factor A
MVHLKFAPQFAFEVDTSFDRAGRIEALLRDTRDARGATGDDDGA